MFQKVPRLPVEFGLDLARRANLLGIGTIHHDLDAPHRRAPASQFAGIRNELPEDADGRVDDNVVPTLESAADCRVRLHGCAHRLGWKSAKTAPPGSRIGVYVPAGPSAGDCSAVAPSCFAF